jgi:hypothetical protein
MTPAVLQLTGSPPASGVKDWATLTVLVNAPPLLAVNVPIVGPTTVVPFSSSADWTRMPDEFAGKPAPVTWMVDGLGRFSPSFGDTSSVTPGWSPDCGVAMATPTPLTVKAMNRASAARWRRAMRFMKRS